MARTSKKVWHHAYKVNRRTDHAANVVGHRTPVMEVGQGKSPAAAGCLQHRTRRGGRFSRPARTLHVGCFCRRPASALSKVDFPAPGGPSSRVKRPGCRMPLKLSRIVNFVLLVFQRCTFCRLPCKDRAVLLQYACLAKFQSTGAGARHMPGAEEACLREDACLTALTDRGQARLGRGNSSCLRERAASERAV